MSRAEYMREYRAKRTAAERDATVRMVGLVGSSTSEGDVAVILGQSKRIAELEAEVKHLKAELAKRVTTFEYGGGMIAGSFNTRPFTPVPRERDKPKK
jgi:hypothetical protein